MHGPNHGWFRSVEPECKPCLLALACAGLKEVLRDRRFTNHCGVGLKFEVECSRCLFHTRPCPCYCCIIPALSKQPARSKYVMGVILPISVVENNNMCQAIRQARKPVLLPQTKPEPSGVRLLRRFMTNVAVCSARFLLFAASCPRERGFLAILLLHVCSSNCYIQLARISWASWSPPPVGLCLQG